jgi:hypothetical protein
MLMLNVILLAYVGKLTLLSVDPAIYTFLLHQQLFDIADLIKSRRSIKEVTLTFGELSLDAI